jgi:hypothetical protein
MRRLVIILLLVLPVSAQADDSDSVPWAGSSVIVRNASTAISADRSADLTYNPYWEVSLTIAPRWQFSDLFWVSASQSFSRELTHSDWTTQDGEFVLSDLGLRTGLSRFATIPSVEIALSSDVALTFPASKASQARTLIMGIGPGLSLSRSFDVADGLSLSYGLRGTYFWHEFTTGQYESPTLIDCERDCGQFLDTGVRNPKWRISNSFGVGLSFLEMVTLSLSYAVITDPLNASSDTLQVSLTPLEPTDTRFRNSFDVSLTVAPADVVSFTLGANTTNSQLNPDGTGYYDLLFNRFTLLYLDVAFDLGAPFSEGSE